MRVGVCSGVLLRGSHSAMAGFCRKGKFRPRLLNADSAAAVGGDRAVLGIARRMGGYSICLLFVDVCDKCTVEGLIGGYESFRTVRHILWKLYIYMIDTIHLLNRINS